MAHLTGARDEEPSHGDAKPQNPTDFQVVVGLQVPSVRVYVAAVDVATPLQNLQGGKARNG